jgi:hypothetical protein
MEFVEGCDFERMTPEFATKVFTGESSKLLFHQIGKIIGLLSSFWQNLAFDIYVNNWDRLPIIWDNEGNLGNLFYQKKEDGAEAIFGIDQSITCISPSFLGFEKYKNKITAFLTELTEKSQQESTGLKKFRELFSMFSGFDFKEEGSIEIQKGICEGLVSCIKLTKEDQEKIKAEVVDMVKVDWENVWKDSMKAINLEFLEAIRSTLAPFEAKLMQNVK